MQLPRLSEVLGDPDVHIGRAEDLIFGLACLTAEGGAAAPAAEADLRDAEARLTADDVHEHLAALAADPEVDEYDLTILSLAASATVRSDLRDAIHLGTGAIEERVWAPLPDWRERAVHLRVLRHDPRWVGPGGTLSTVYLGRRAEVRVLVVENGTTWCFPWGEVRTVPGDRALVDWETPDRPGELVRTALEVDRASPAEDMTLALALLYDDEDDNAEDELAIAIAGTFQEGAARDALEEGALAVAVNLPVSDDLRARIGLAFETRLLLEALYEAVPTGHLAAALAEADVDVGGCGPALALLSYEEYEGIAGDDVPTEGWWGWLERRA